MEMVARGHVPLQDFKRPLELPGPFMVLEWTMSFIDLWEARKCLQSSLALPGQHGVTKAIGLGIRKGGS